jgi:hypothetical protein
MNGIYCILLTEVKGKIHSAGTIGLEIAQRLGKAKRAI